MTTPKFHPMLYTPDMVSQLLAGDKTRTRRLLKFPAGMVPRKMHLVETLSDDPVLKAYVDHQDGHSYIKFPYGKIGDIIWVRETIVKNWNGLWKYKSHDKGRPANSVKKNSTRSEHGVTTERILSYSEEVSYCDYLNNLEFANRRDYIPNIHMPKGAARIFLRIDSVKLERIKDISREEAILEGMCFPEGQKPSWIQEHRFPEENFLILFEKLHGPEVVRNNDVVWVIGFTRIHNVAFVPSENEFILQNN